MGRRKPDPLRAAHAELNRGTERHWDRYADCRERVMTLVGEPTSNERRIAVLGAGNCNDIDLRSLTERFEEVHLVDIDRPAMVKARERASVRASCHTHDLSGMLKQLPKWKRRPPSAQQLAARVQRAGPEAREALPAPVGCVLSSLLLSQLVHSAMVALGTDHASLPVVARTMVLAHVEMVAALAAPDARVVFVVDTLARPSDAMARALEQHGADELLVRSEAAGRCLPGTEVSFVAGTVERRFGGGLTDLVPAWTWSPGSQTHLTYGLVVDRGRS